MKIPTSILRKMGVGAACVTVSMAVVGADSPARAPVHAGLGPTSKAAAKEDPSAAPSPAPRPIDHHQTSRLWQIWKNRPDLTLAQVRKLDDELAQLELTKGGINSADYKLRLQQALTEIRATTPEVLMNCALCGQG